MILQSQLQHTQARLEQEHAHFERIDLAWREAEERAANLQSELERVRRRLAGGDDADGAGEEPHEADHDELEETMDNGEEFAIEAAEGMADEPEGASPEHAQGEQMHAGYAQ